MPFGIKKSGYEWEVYNKETGKVYGKHKTKKKAIRQLRAIKMNYKESNYMLSESSELLFSLSKKYKIPLQQLESMWKDAMARYEDELKKKGEKIDKSKQSFWNGVIKELKKLIDNLNLGEAKLIMNTKEKFRESLSKWLDCVQTDNYVEANKIFPDVIKYKTQLILNKKKNTFLKKLANQINHLGE